MKLIKALERVGGQQCIAAAERLANSARDESAGIDLHLRNMNLDLRAISIIAHAMKSLSVTESSLLRSLSFSYNEALADEGTVKLVSALPETLVELGMVGCKIGDPGGEALLQWANNAPHLAMLCIEDNQLSAPMKSRFVRLGRSNPGLLLVV